MKARSEQAPKLWIAIKRWLRIQLVAWAILSVIVAAIAIRIASYPETIASGQYDCAIVLGAALDGSTKPSPVFEGRLEHAQELYQKGIVKRIVLTGGVGKGSKTAESEAGRDYLVERGVPSEVIALEKESHTTHANLVEAKKVMAERGYRNAVIVSDPLHLYRASSMAKGLQMETVSSGSPTTRYKNWSSKAPFLLREVLFTVVYWVAGQ